MLDVICVYMYVTYIYVSVSLLWHVALHSEFFKLRLPTVFVVLRPFCLRFIRQFKDLSMSGGRGECCNRKPIGNTY